MYMSSLSHKNGVQVVRVVRIDIIIMIKTLTGYKATIKLSDEDLLLLGIWHADGRAAVVGAVRTVDGEVVPDALRRVGATWQAIADALTDASAIGAGAWALLCNDAALVTTLASKRAPVPTETATMRKGRELVTAQYGGDAAHWEVLRRLAAQGRWTVMQSAKLEKARELWQQG